MKNIWTIARREVKALFDQPTGYVLLVVFLAINAFIFFRNAYLANTASLRPMLDLLPWIFLFFVPAVSMRSLAEDNRTGLLEIVLSQPVSEAQLVAGKYLGVLLVLLGSLATTILIPVGMTLGADLQWGPIFAQYIGSALLAAGFAGVGVWASSLSSSQITAFILGVAVMFLLILVGLDPLLVGLPPTLGAFAARLGVLSHFESIGRGVLDLRDLLYFVSLAAVFLTLAYAVVLRRRLSKGSPAARQLRIGTGLLVAVLVVVNLAGGQIGGRIDLTPGNAYTLSKASKNIVRSLEDIVTIKLFASDELPSEFALQKRDVDDMLRDLRGAGRGKIRVVERDPADDQAAAEDARNLGVVPVQFNVVGQSELQVKEGFLGIVVQHADKHEAIPFVQRTDDLEYRLVSIMRSLTRAAKPKVALLTDPQAGQFNILREQLDRSYQIDQSFGADTESLAGYAAVIIAGQRDSSAFAEMDKVRAYLAGGGKAFIMESGMQISPQAPIASAKQVAWNALLSEHGVTIKQDMVYDLRANQMVGVPTALGRLLRPYPYFLRGQSTRLSTINAELNNVSLAWTSTIDTTPGKGITPLLTTTDAGGVASGTAMIDPSQDFPTTDLGVRLLAVQVAPSDSAGARLVVVGNSTFASDEFLNRSPENLAFALNAVDWLAQDEALIAIRAKDRRPPPLVFESNGTKDAIKYFNVAGLPIALAVVGAVRLLRRRRLALAPYQPLAKETA